MVLLFNLLSVFSHTVLELVKSLGFLFFFKRLRTQEHMDVTGASPNLRYQNHVNWGV